MLNKILNLPRPWIYLLVALAVAIPLILGWELPVRVTPPVKNLFEEVESTPDSQAVLLSCDYDPSLVPELYPMTVAILRHCLSAKKHILIMSLYPQGVGLAQMALEDVKKEFPNAQEGIDYTFLGFTPGYSMVILGLGEDIHEVFPRDYYGNPIDSLPMMRKIHNFNDINVVITLCGSGIYSTWVVYANTKYRQKVGVGATAVIAPAIYPYLQTGQLVGLLGGLKGASEYEYLVYKKGYSTGRRRACERMGAQTTTHLLIIGMIILCNVLYSIQRRRRRTQ